METTHRVTVGDSREMEDLADDSVELVVTSPPYPMIEMWDGIFEELNPEIEQCLSRGAGREAFELMHEELAATWAEVARVLVEGGIACIVVGDATRSLDGRFERFPNHVRITEWFFDNGFLALPDILWRKPTNSAAKFMGSGMLPPNAYVTLEHEYILVFRRGKASRSFEPAADRRYQAAYFWEERNEWFSDVWMDVRGTFQELPSDKLRERSGAFPFEVPYRLINMYSVYDDTVLDPYWGTGTTSLAAMVAGRDSVGYEREEAFTDVFDERVGDVRTLSRSIIDERLARHRTFVSERREAGEEPDYRAKRYDLPVVTEQERDIRFTVVTEVERRDDRYVATHADWRDAETVESDATRSH